MRIANNVLSLSHYSLESEAIPTSLVHCASKVVIKHHARFSLHLHTCSGGTSRWLPRRFADAGVRASGLPATGPCRFPLAVDDPPSSLADCSVRKRTLQHSPSRDRDWSGRLA